MLQKTRVLHGPVSLGGQGIHRHWEAGAKELGAKAGGQAGGKSHRKLQRLIAFVAVRVPAVLAYGLVCTIDASFCSVIVPSMTPLGYVHVTAGPSSARRLADASI